ncbi:hypothetical protein D8Y20_00085 [Mariprofundus sp. EBB-1]|uniref:hypothetical protein n=1 Tax=Mariprofundus sp. EBB-1 TaxID=2650971 RepID=UPI000EF18AB0|nr:hypothetical protein [Mariprofundus sp. EBB-1]RLL55885.1 hypothetical protein D8Y20_00085 [Mariprofundus sp. EBB-1]
MSAVVTYVETLKICRRHADRLQWSMNELEACLPFTVESLDGVSDIQLAVLDQFASRFSRLQDAMGAKLFSAVLELTKEQGSLDAFVDKLNRLEKIGAIPSVNDWLILREMRNAFSHEYPDDPEIQVAILNKAFVLARGLIATLTYLEIFANRYI